MSQTDIYNALCLKEWRSAKKILAETKISRSAIYSQLKRMVRYGLVECQKRDVKVYRIKGGKAHGAGESVETELQSK